jgi:MFS family permease
VGGIVALLGQMPGGALVDSARSARLVAALAVAAICVSCLTLALWPIYPVVMGGRVLQAGASCILGPALAALSLRLAGHAGLGERIGRNARFAAIGSAVGAASMGACGYLFSEGAVFFLAAAMVLPALLALARVSAIPPQEVVGDAAESPHEPVAASSLFANRTLLVFAGCILVFHLANAAMLPLMSGIVAKSASAWTTPMVAACMIGPQVVVALCAPWAGRHAQARGRRPLLVACFAALCLRGVLFAFVHDPRAVVAIQILDGISGAALGVLYPLIIADITRTSGRFNLALGLVGSAVGVGASLSTVLAGIMYESTGATATFLALAAVAAVGLVLVRFVMPETRPASAPAS